MTRAEFLDEIHPDKSLKRHRHLNSSALRFIFLQTAATSYFKLQYTVKEKGRKPDRAPYPLPHGVRNLYRNLKSENSQD
jgi:hypothetical protein